MRVVFAYDGYLFKDGNGNWYGRNYADLPYRYRILSQDIVFLMRTKNDEKASEKMTPMPQGTVVTEVPNYLSAGVFLKNRIKAYRIIEKQIMDSDVVIARLPGFISQVAIAYAKKHNKPYIVELVGCVRDSLNNHSLLGKLMSSYEYIRIKRIISSSDYVMYVTNEFLQKRYPCKLGNTIGVSDVVTSPIDFDQLENRYVVDKDYLAIGTAGAIDVKYKGQEYVIRALGKLKRDGIVRYTYHIAGSGDKTRLEHIAKEERVDDLIVFDGSIPHDNISNWYDSLDLYVQPSLVEGMPRSLLEAMSRGLPCFGSNIGGIPELLPSSSLFEPSSCSEVVELLIKIDREYLETTAKTCLEKSRQYTPQLLKNRRDAFYLQFLKDNGLN